MSKVGDNLTYLYDGLKFLSLKSEYGGFPDKLYSVEELKQKRDDIVRNIKALENSE